MKLKFPVKSVIILIAFTAALVFAKDYVLKYMITAGATHAVGAKVTAGSVSWSVSKQLLTVKDLKIYNPEGFDEVPMIFVSSLVMDYTLSAVAQRVPVINVLEVDVREIVVIKNKEGVLNVNSLTLDNDNDGETPKRKRDAPFPLEIKQLKLNVHQLVSKDYSKGTEPVIKAYDIGLKDKVFKNVPSTRKLVALVLFNSLRKTSIKGAKVYALAAFLGPAFMPASAAIILTGKDHAGGEYDGTLETLYPKALEVLKSIGEVKKEAEDEGLIEAFVDGHQVFVRIENIEPEDPEQPAKKAKITVSARKLTLPKPHFAGGILYQVRQEI